MPTIKTYRKVGAFYIAWEADFSTSIRTNRSDPTCNAHRDLDHEIQSALKLAQVPWNRFMNALPVAHPFAAHFKMQRVSASFAEAETHVHKTQDVV